MSLLDKIQERLANAKPAQAGPAPDQRQLQSMLSQKATGKQARTAGPAASSLMASSASKQASEAMRATKAEGARQAAQLKELSSQQEAEQGIAQDRMRQEAELQRQGMQEQEAQITAERQRMEQDAAAKRTAEQSMQLEKIRNQYTQAIQNMTTDRKITTDDLFANYQQAQTDLADRRDASQLEQLAHTLALSDQQYIDMLEAIGTERRLTSDLSFAEEVARVSMDAGMENLLDELGFLKEMNVDARNWEEVLARITGNDAVKIARMALEEETTRSAFEGLGSATSKLAEKGYFDGDEK